MDFFTRSRSREKKIAAAYGNAYKPISKHSDIGIPTHSAIKVTDGGERVEVEINFRDDAPLSLVTHGGEHSLLRLDQTMLSILPRYANIARSLKVIILFPSTPASVHFTRTSETFIRTLSNLINSFQNADSIQVAAKIGVTHDRETNTEDFIWEQLKHMVYFYRCTVKDLRLYIAAGEGMEWRLVQEDSPLHRRLMSHKEGLVNGGAFSDVGSS
ncbi:hypothetical protein HYALB_00012990 [Hymenoscyphus albidus]|uniref:Uncharacterized protein n=1 Tax=Hymenoscyphus albidus TaxID=595503 RepID=A0A9N9LYA0_9HELO|nr:hypothetical protein HYALB_00012990 [Hymenoscyphus albidus]